MVLVQPSDSPRMIPASQAEEPGADQTQPGQVEGLVGAGRLGQPTQGQGIRARPTGTFSQKDPVPGDAFDDGTAEERSERDAQSADAAPDPEKCRPRFRPGRLPRPGSG